MKHPFISFLSGTWNKQNIKNSKDPMNTCFSARAKCRNHSCTDWRDVFSMGEILYLLTLWTTFLWQKRSKQSSFECLRCWSFTSYDLWLNTEICKPTHNCHFHLQTSCSSPCYSIVSFNQWNNANWLNKNSCSHLLGSWDFFLLIPPSLQPNPTFRLSRVPQVSYVSLWTCTL